MFGNVGQMAIWYPYQNATPPINDQYVEEDGTTPYVAEDGTTPYVLET